MSQHPSSGQGRRRTCEAVGTNKNLSALPDVCKQRRKRRSYETEQQHLEKHTRWAPSATTSCGSPLDMRAADYALPLSSPASARQSVDRCYLQGQHGHLAGLDQACDNSERMLPFAPDVLRQDIKKPDDNISGVYAAWAPVSGMPSSPCQSPCCHLEILVRYPAIVYRLANKLPAPVHPGKPAPLHCQQRGLATGLPKSSSLPLHVTQQQLGSNALRSASLPQHYCGAVQPHSMVGHECQNDHKVVAPGGSMPLPSLPGSINGWTTQAPVLASQTPAPGCVSPSSIEGCPSTRDWLSWDLDDSGWGSADLNGGLAGSGLGCTDPNWGSADLTLGPHKIEWGSGPDPATVCESNGHSYRRLSVQASSCCATAASSHGELLLGNEVRPPSLLLNTDPHPTTTTSVHPDAPALAAEPVALDVNATFDAVVKMQDSWTCAL